MISRQSRIRTARVVGAALAFAWPLANSVAADARKTEKTAVAAADTGMLDRTAWTASADSEQSVSNAAAAAIDGNMLTIWHTAFHPLAVPLPHWIAIDMQQPQTISAVVYQPRPGGGKGTIGKYEVAVSVDGVYYMKVANGAWTDGKDSRTATFPEVVARFVKLTALSEAGYRGPFASAAEINVMGRRPAGAAAPGQ
jgi:galactose oxidase